MSKSIFDEHAETYDQDLDAALSISGEDKNYFANGRIKWLSEWLSSNGYSSDLVLDYGCGTGSATPFIKQYLKPSEVIGVDVSHQSLDVAIKTFGESKVSFLPIDVPKNEKFDLAFCNGVFHHIDPDERQKSLEYVFNSLQPGGIFALFENNPWNPATRYVMSRCKFDRGVITLAPPETRHRMQQAGFKIICTRYLFVFPSLLKLLRPFETPLSVLPFGTQYVVVGVKS